MATKEFYVKYGLIANGNITFTDGTNYLDVGNSTINAVVNSSFVKIANSTSQTNVSLGTIALGSAFLANSTVLNHTGNINAASHSTTSFLANNTGVYHTNLTANSLGVYHTGVINAATHSSGAGFTANSTLVAGAAVNVTGQTNTATLFVTTSANIASSNVIANTQGVFVANTSGVVNAFSLKTAGVLANTTALVPTSNTILLGNTIGRWVITANSIDTTGLTGNATMATATALNVTNQTNTATLYATTTANVGTTQLSTSQLHVGSTTVNAVVNSTAVKISSNSTTFATLTQGSLVLANTVSNTTIAVPTTTERAGAYFLKADGTWTIVSSAPPGSDTYVVFNDGGSVSNALAGMTFTKGSNTFFVSNTITVSSGINANGSGIFPTSNTLNFGNSIGRWIVTANSVATQGVSANATALNPTSNTILLGNTIGLWVISANSITTTGLTGNATMGTATAFNVTNQVNTATLYASTTANVGTTQVSTSQLHVGSTTINAVVNSTAVKISSNSTTFATLTQGSLVLANTVSNTTIAVPTTTQRAGNYYLKADGTWTELSHVASGSDTQVQFNDGGTLANGSAGFTFTKSTNNVTVGNSISAAIHSTSGWSGNTIALNPTANTILLGNTIGRWVISANTIDATGNIRTTGNVNGAIGYFTGVVNATTFTTTGNANAGSGFFTGTVNAAHFTTTGNANAGSGFFTGTVNAAHFTTTGNANASSIYVGANVNINTTAIFAGNSTVNSTLTVAAANLYVANSTANTLISPGTILINGSALSGGASLNANNTHDTTYYVGLSVNSTGSWTNAVVATTKLYFNPSSGTLSATDFNSLSDMTMKENITPINSALEKIDQINGVTFNWKENGIPAAGILAQEVKEILPQIVTDKMTVSYAGVIALLVEAVKELKHKLEEK